MVDDSILLEVVRMTFEEMAFLDIEQGAPQQPASAVDEGPVLYLAYMHPRAGAFALVLPKLVKFKIAEAIYGEDWQTLSPNKLDDSLLELLNVLAGRLLTARFGPSIAYKMGLPTVLYDPPEALPRANERKLIFHYDEQLCTLTWWEVA